jgi:predicted transcriptional regulator
VIIDKVIDKIIKEMGPCPRCAFKAAHWASIVENKIRLYRLRMLEEEDRRDPTSD